jgi:hypothetical protein
MARGAMIGRTGEGEARIAVHASANLASKVGRQLGRWRGECKGWVTMLLGGTRTRGCH